MPPAPTPTPAQRAALDVGGALADLADVLRSPGAATRPDWPPPELQKARAALLATGAVLGNPGDRLLLERARDQAALLGAMSQRDLVRHVAYWEACASAWGTWARSPP